MKKIILIGSVASGKTTICQYLNDMVIKYKKTQAVEIYNETIDTPGEYLDNHHMWRTLMVTAADAEQIIFIQDASREIYHYAPGCAASFTQPVAGVITKIDIATEKQIRDARELLEMAGAAPIFEVCPLTGEGMESLRAFLE